MTKTVAPRVSRYLGAKPIQRRSPVPASTNATSSNDVLRRSARNSAQERSRERARLAVGVSLALRVEGVIDDELALEYVVIAQSQRTEAKRDPTQSLARGMRFLRVRV